MRRLLLLGLLAATRLLAAPEAANAQLSFGPKAGLNLATIHYSKLAAGYEQPDLLAAPSLGLMVNYRRGKVALQPAVLYSQKGYYFNQKFHDVFNNVTHDSDEDLKTRINYLEVPVHLVYTPNGRQGIQVYAGAYMAFGVGGKQKGTSSDRATNSSGQQLYDDHNPVNKDVKFGTKPGELKRFDVGLDAGLGYLVKNFQIQVGYSLGLGT